MQDETRIFDNDYQTTTEYLVGNIIRETGHAIKVAQVGTLNTGGQKRIKQTKEKFRESRIYIKTYDLPPGSESSSMYKKK